MIEKGADLVVCQHTHCVGCEEDFLNGKIIYGQGNFIFDKKDNEYWNFSILLNCAIKNDRTIDYSYVPITKDKGAIRLAEGEKAQNVLNDYFKRSSEITIPGFIEKKYSEYASKQINNYLSAGFGVFRSSLPGKIINRLFRRKIWSLFFRKKDYLSLIDQLECESHYELFRHAIRDRIHNDILRHK